MNGVSLDYKLQYITQKIYYSFSCKKYVFHLVLLFLGLSLSLTYDIYFHPLTLCQPLLTSQS